MKIAYAIMSAALLLVASCVREEMPQGNDDQVAVTLNATAEQQTEETRTAISNTNTVIWESSDMISVLSCLNSKTSNNLFSVKEIDPSNPGVATFEGKITTGRSEYYALYPYSATAKYDGASISFSLPQTQIYAEGSFGHDTNVSVARFESKTDALQFKNILGVFKLSLTGNGENVTKVVLQNRNGEPLWGDAVLAADDRMGTYEQSLEVSKGDNTLILDCSTVNITLSSTATAFYFTAPAHSFDEGLDIFIYDGSGVKYHMGAAQDNGLIRSRILAMPTIAAKTTELNLSAHGTANSYMVSVPGIYNFIPAKGCGGEEFTPASVGILWATEGTTTAPASIDTIVSNVEYSDGKISFTATGKPGNAVIAAFDNSGNIQWSWHIWSTGGYVKTVEYPVEAKVRMMDRDLGGLGCTREEGALCSGLIYQWGRKDPFPGAADIAPAAQKTTPPAQAATAVKSGYSFGTENNATGSVGTTAYTVLNPMTFVSCDNGYNDNDWLVGHDTTLWTPEKGINDPCPPGYRVPDRMFGWVANASNMQFVSSSRGYVMHGTEWYGEHGYIYRCTGEWCDGPYDAMTEWWGCSESTTNSYYLAVHVNTDKITASISTPKKANAYGVRCCRDMKY